MPKPRQVYRVYDYYEDEQHIFHQGYELGAFLRDKTREYNERNQEQISSPGGYAETLDELIELAEKLALRIEITIYGMKCEDK